MCTRLLPLVVLGAAVASPADDFRFSIETPTSKVLLLSSKPIEFVGKKPKFVPPPTPLRWPGFLRILEHEIPPVHGVFDLKGKPTKPTVTVLGQTNRRLAADVSVEFQDNAFDVEFNSPGKATFRASVGKYWSQDVQVEIRQLPVWKEMSAADLLERFGMPSKKYGLQDTRTPVRSRSEFWRFDQCPGYLFEIRGEPGTLVTMIHESRTAQFANRLVPSQTPESNPAVPLFRVETFSWKPQEPAVRMIHLKEGLCVLSMISGRFQGGGEGIKVSVRSDGRWYIDGRSQQPIHAKAFAVQSDTVRLPSVIRTVSWGPNDGAIRLINSKDGFCFLSAVSGGFRGGGEAVRVGLAADGFWYLSGKSVTPVQAVAAVVPWGTHSKRPDRVLAFKWAKGDPPVKMLHKNAGFCVLSGVGGAFQGGGEVVEISLGPDDFWYLSGKSGQLTTSGEAVALEFSTK